MRSGQAVARVPARRGCGRLTVLLALLGGVALLLAGCGSSSEPVVARVGDRAITSAQVQHWAAVLSAAQHGRGVSDERAAALRLLIQEAWTRGEAAELGVVVSERAARRRLAQYRYEALEGLRPAAAPAVEAPFPRLLTSHAVSSEDSVAAMRTALLAEGVRRAWRVEAKRRVSGGEIRRYYVRHRARFLAPERRDIEIIETKTLAAARAARRAIESGRGFLSVAKERSVDPGAPGGLRQGFRRSEGARRLADAIFAARPRVLVGPRVVALYYVFEVLRVHPARFVPLEQARGAIKRQLASEAAGREVGPMSARRWKARTRCAAGPMRGLCGRIARSAPGGRAAGQRSPR